MARIEMVLFFCSWIAQAAGDLIDMLSLDQIPGRLTDLLSIDHRLKALARHKGAPTTAHMTHG